MATHLASNPLLGPPLPRYRDPEEVTPLKEATVSGNLDRVREIFESYLANRAPENYDIFKFFPVLLTAVEHDRPQIASYLLGLGVPLGLMDIEQAIKTKSTAIFDVFLRHGWDINKPLTEMQPTALAFLVGDWDMTNWFLDHGADPNARCFFDITPLSWAVKIASLQTINLLFDRGGDVQKGQLAHFAIDRDDEKVVEVLELLLQKGASLKTTMYHNDLPSWNLQYFRGLGTTLQRAAELGKVDVARYLIQHGVDPSIKDSKGLTAIDYARRYKHHEIVELLESL